GRVRRRSFVPNCCRTSPFASEKDRRCAARCEPNPAERCAEVFVLPLPSTSLSVLRMRPLCCHYRVQPRTEHFAGRPPRNPSTLRNRQFSAAVCLVLMAPASTVQLKSTRLVTASNAREIARRKS